MTTISGISTLLWTSAAQAASPAVSTDLSKLIASSGVTPQGYNGADGKLSINASNGTISTTNQIKGKDAGFFVGLRPVATNGATKLTLTVTGDVFNGGLDHYVSIQVVDSAGQRRTLEVCNEGKYGACLGKPVTGTSALKSGQTLSVDISGMADIARIEVIFPGTSEVSAGFTVSNIVLTK
jgi:hypothetical protein